MTSDQIRAIRVIRRIAAALEASYAVDPAWEPSDEEATALQNAADIAAGVHGPEAWGDFDILADLEARAEEMEGVGN